MSYLFKSPTAQCLTKTNYFYYTYRNCDTNLNSNTPANRYQLQKRIQKTVRVSSSEYAMNKAALTAATIKGNGGILWNQQSDRLLPSKQKATIPTGCNTSMNKKHSSQTSSRPGTQTPGGIGCDIKHNSYDRYLNRLKGSKALKRSAIPDIFVLPKIPFNRAFPIYGSKMVKTAIVHGGGAAGEGCVECSSKEFSPFLLSEQSTESYLDLNSELQERFEGNINRKTVLVDNTPFFPTSSASENTRQKRLKTQACFLETAPTPFMNI
jgi:hypothetical protein